MQQVPTPALRYLATVSGLVGVYYLAAIAGLSFAIPPGNSTVIWPGSGIAVAAMLLFGYRVWPGVWLGALLGTLSTDASLANGCVIGIGNTLEAITATWLIRHILPTTFIREARDAFLFTMVAGSSCVVAASIGVASLYMTGAIPPEQAVVNWWTWWLGDMAGQMLVVPLILAIVGKRYVAHTKFSMLELLLMFALIVLVSQITFAGWFPDRIAQDFRYVPAILLIWACLRFELLEVSSSIILFAAATVWGIHSNGNSFRAGDVQQSLFDLQVFLNVYAITGLAFFGIVAARRQAERTLTESLQNLEQMVTERTQQFVGANKDLQREIDERTQTEKTLRESEKRFRTLFEQAGDALFVVSFDGNLVDFNRRASEALGYTRNELLNLGVTDIDANHNRQRFRETAASLSPDSMTIIESICRRKDGTTFPVEIRACSIQLGDDQHMLALAYDISNRKRVEELEHLQLESAFESIGDGILITDLKGTIQLVNPAFERITGHGHQELIGENPRVLQGGTHDRQFYKEMWKTLTSGEVWRGSFVDQRKDGSVYDAETTIAPVRTASEDVAGYIAVTRDVTERNRMAQALHDSEARMRAIVDNAAEGIITFNEQGMLESCNPAVTQIFGYSTDEMLNQPVTMLMPESSCAECRTSIERFLETGQCEAIDENREFLGKRKDGSAFPMDLGVSKVQLGNRRLFTGIIRDVTERHARQKAERALLVTEENLRVARTIQQGFFPAAAPRVPGIDIGGASFPAEATGGDYYDYLPMSDQNLGIVLGDVSGHGIGPALLMSQTHAFLHALVPACGDASELATRLNSFMTDGINSDRFVTLFLAQIDPRTQTFFYAGAGHNGFLFDTDGEVRHLEATGFPLGVTGDPVPNSPTIPFKPGQILTTLTDGVYETMAPDQTQFGIQRALDFIWDNRSRPAGEIVNALYLAVSDYAQGELQQDDITIVIVKFE